MKKQNWLLDLLPTDLEACNSSSSFLQSGYWGSFKARFGWNARSFEAVWKQGSGNKAEPEKRPILVIRRRLGPLISFAYVPWGPEFPADFPHDWNSKNVALEELASVLRQYLPRDTAFVRFDPPWYSEGALVPAPELSFPFVRSGADIQAPDTVIVNLEDSKDAIMGKMKNKWRYNSRLALKRGVIIRRPDEEGLEIFYTLLKETARRDHISIHNFNYYKILFSHTREYQNKEKKASASVVPDIHLYTAEYEGETLAANVVLFRGREAVYLYGASSGSKRNLMAPYALQVRAMMDAREAGCTEYDLFGIPPREDPHHPMAGLYRFKTGFGGQIIHRPGSWDYPYRRAAMKLFGFMESLRKDLRDFKKRKSPNENNPET